MLECMLYVEMFLQVFSVIWEGCGLCFSVPPGEPVAVSGFGTFGKAARLTERINSQWFKGTFAGNIVFGVNTMGFL